MTSCVNARGLAGTIVNANMDGRKAERLGVDTHERGEENAAGCGGAAPSMAEGTAGAEPAGGAEKATAARLEALEPVAYGEVGGAC